MTVEELVKWCNDNGVDPSTAHIALRVKDDFFLTPEGVSFEAAYFGNCHEGTKWEDANLPIVDGEPDYDNPPKVLILDTRKW
jgi:hypothetical protein